MGELVAKIKAKLACYNRIHSHLKKRWKTFSAPNASYSKKYLSQSKSKRLYLYVYLPTLPTLPKIQVPITWRQNTRRDDSLDIAQQSLRRPSPITSVFEPTTLYF